MKLKVSIALLIILIVSAVLYFKSFDASKGKVKLKCYYMAYACGDCYPQYRIDKILEGNLDTSYLGKEISLEFEIPEKESELDNKTGRCITCYDFYLTGLLKRSKTKGIYLLTEEAEAKLRNKSCCTK